MIYVAFFLFTFQTQDIIPPNSVFMYKVDINRLIYIFIERERETETDRQTKQRDRDRDRPTEIN